MRVLAIVPAFNEEGTVGGVVRELLARCDADVVVVNDGSTDGTSAEARRAGARVLDLPLNLGIGGAVQAGFVMALREGYDVAVQVDGDGQHDPSGIDALLAPIAAGEADFVLGSRYAQPGDYRAPIARRLGMVVFSAAVSAMTGRRLRDTTSGFRASGREVLAYCAEHYPRDYPEVEALLLLSRAGFRIAEVPCPFRERTEGRSSFTGGKAAYYMVKVLLALFVGLFRGTPERSTGEDA
ncbi:MAG: glycosyltransferase family 2 protein [Gemmatimonadota bacterium]|jgi:hypothetical protein|nr:glycosyltransferase family 2 protein [Gemmatimonadota bacterium]